MKNLISILFLVLLFSCTNPNATLKSDNHPSNVYKLNGNNYIFVTEIEGCEYLVFDGYKAGGIVHKANCKNH